MDSTELLKKVRKIEIKTRGLSKHIFAGEYHSAFKGRGMSFSEVREYQFGDDVRNIDWNVTARFHKPFIKVFEEERELTVMLLIDMSGSKNFGTKLRFKEELVTEVSAVLAFSAIHNNDKIGVIFFSDRVEKFIPPKKGKKHILHIIRELIDFEPVSSQTNISTALKYLTGAIKKRSTVFIISDFMDKSFEKPLQIAAYKHDVIALQIFDIREQILPPIGFVKLKDAETGKEMWINTSNKKLRDKYENDRLDFDKKLKTTFAKCGVDFAKLQTDKDYIQPILGVFKKR